MDQLDKREKKTEEEKACLHWLIQAAGAGNRSFLRALFGLGTAREIFALALSGRLADRLAQRYRKRAARLTESSKACDPEQEYGRMRERGIGLVAQGEAAFPKRLSKIPDSPLALYYAGRLPSDQKRAVALIGARDCTEYGRYMAARFGAALAGAAWPEA